jgi:hypothetical protein
MPWLWNSWEEYRDWVHPSSIRRGFWGLSHQQTWNEAESKLWDAVHRLTESRNSLCKLGFTGSDDDFPPDSPADLSRVRHLVITVIHCGETLLLYHKRLAKSEASYGFLHQIDLLEHWDRYASTGRIASEIHQLVTDLRDLLQGYEAFLRAEDKFIIGGLDLPTSLESDFLLARNLFSVGFDDVGLLIAGRGLEGVLRKIAHDRKILLEIKGKAAPASESDFFDLHRNYVSRQMENQENSFPELGNESTDALPEDPAERRRSCGNPGVAIPRESERGSRSYCRERK